MKRRKTLTIAIVLAFFVISTFASNDSLSPFISILLGRQTYMSHEKTQWSGNVNGNTNYRYGTDQFASELAIGANQNWDAWNLGIETFYDIIPIHNNFISTSNNPIDNYTIKQNLRNTFGIRILPGYYLEQRTLIYIPIGWANSQFSLSSNAPNNIPSYTQRINGLQFGLGIEEAINDQLHLRLEYINTDYRHFSINYQGNTQTKNRGYSLSTNQFNVGLAYYLCHTNSNQTKLTALSEGWHLGIGFGKSIQTAILDIRDAGFHQKQNLSGNGLLGDILLGFDHQFISKFYLGTEAEFFIDSATHNQSINLDDGELLIRHAKMKSGYHLSILPGYQIAPNFRLYTRIGFARGNYQYDTSLGTQSYNQSKVLNGAVLGIGGELGLARHWAIQGEYQETRYRSSSKSIDTVNESIRPNTHYYLMNLIYYFN